MSMNASLLSVIGSAPCLSHRHSVVIAICLLTWFALPLYAWPGHQWENWQKVTTWTRPDVKTDQAGKKHLVRLLDTAGPDGKPHRIGEIKAWERRRAEITNVIGRIMGGPTDLKPPKPEAKVLGEETLKDHIRRHIKIRTEPNDWIPAYLLLPKDLPVGRHPTMICLHQTVGQGKQEPCGIKGSADLAFALQLVRRGYVCIAPDVIGFGERIPSGTQPYHDTIAFYRRHPKWSFFGKMNWDISRVIDYLETLPCVDPKRIGSIGHSHGAYGTLFAAAFEPRISAAIASCGFTTFRTDPKPHRWSHLTALLPQLGVYLPEVASIPFDWQHVCALIAPRSLFVWYTTKDGCFPNTDNLDGLFKDVRTVYDLYGAAEDLGWAMEGGAHRLPQHARDRAYTWLKARFRRTPDPTRTGRRP